MKLVTDNERETKIREEEKAREAINQERWFKSSALPDRHKVTTGELFTEHEKELGLKCIDVLISFFKEKQKTTTIPGIAVVGDIDRVDLFCGYFAKKLIVSPPKVVSGGVYYETYGSLGQYDFYDYYGEEYFAWDFFTRKIGILFVTDCVFGNPHSNIEKYLMARRHNEKFTILGTQYSSVKQLMASSAKSDNGVMQLLTKKYLIIDLSN